MFTFHEKRGFLGASTTLALRVGTVASFVQNELQEKTQTDAERVRAAVD